MENILCIDQATTTGWAVATYIDSDIQYISGFKTFSTPKELHKEYLKARKLKDKKNVRNIGNALQQIRYVEFYNFLEETLKKYNINKIFYEEPEFMQYSSDASHLAGGWIALIMIISNINQIECVGIPVGTIKKHITGKGTAKKEQIVVIVNEKYKNIVHHTIEDHNEADALALLDYAMLV